MRDNIKTTQKNILMAIVFGTILLSFITMTFTLLKKTMASAPQLNSTSFAPDTKNTCTAGSEQTVVHWVDMRWFPCKFSLFGICIWPPLQRNHATYKITLNDGVPLRDDHNKLIVIAKEKIRTWAVYDSTRWNNIADSPRELARFPGFKTIEPNEYVVMVETRYRLFNDVESTLRLCTQP